ncbi:thiosulfate oxidation carrier complex protein SoxZ [Ponticaulis sp.]|uniref:thiosulfate oxidation carrier complex protein SoxZ n=1 Tax=Ponticaulis sp. TaxID=2020902 RepID=UPI000B6701DB|nr:thiosulfate oxidation carrier complex protein SoxZ [Ponticaulis sp.]MAI89521.1 thiosulfate oxidation carrier complex protein SoxZ [Ponticaulis sp.]OUY00554.1 MAG: thiosulfate oxidation carrier complex protein SoxZ [Hyphomonadaceae bacterium TMED5]|tara:strand:+ start:179666 stop:179986 length:321 start_codon:yes stop_codon:yes gene_type:complete
MTTIRLSVPDTAERDEIIQIRAMIQHDMESGFRVGARGEFLPRDIITRFECFYNGDQVFAADFHPGVAANPFLEFHVRATDSGSFEFVWTDQHGEVWTDTASIQVS